MFLKISPVVLWERKGREKTGKISEKGEKVVGTTICTSIGAHIPIFVENKIRLSEKKEEQR